MEPCLGLAIGIAIFVWRIHQKNPYHFPKGGGGKRVEISQPQFFQPIEPASA